MDEINLNFVQLNRHQVLQRYSATVRQFRELAENHYDVRPLILDNYVFYQYFQQRDDLSAGERNAGPSTYLKLEVFNHLLDRRRKIICWLFYLLLLSLCIAAYRYEATGRVNERVAQSFKYPGMRMWRRMTMPLIQRFPRLTEFYDETCIMGNPFFQLENLSCEPCAHVNYVWFEHDECVWHENDNSTQHGSGNTVNLSEQQQEKRLKCRRPNADVPSLFKSYETPVALFDVYKIYKHNHEIFQRDAYRVYSTQRDVHNLKDLFNQFNSTMSNAQRQRQQRAKSQNLQKQQQEQPQQQHNLWRCNRMLPARLLRPILARPKHLPNMGIALERFMTIDTSQAAAYSLPETECPNVYVQQLLGTRFIILRPTSECRYHCRTLSVRLPQYFVLNYNGLYWKSISAPDPISDTLSISMIGSYC